MTKQIWLFLLTIVLFLAVTVVLACALLPEQGPDTLSVLVLRPGEGNAVIVSCGGQSLLLPMGDEKDAEDLSNYLKRQRLLQIEHTVDPAETASFSVPLGDALCQIKKTASGVLTVHVTHAENRMCLRISPNDSPELSMNSSGNRPP